MPVLDPRRGEYPTPGATYVQTMVDPRYGLVIRAYVRVVRVVRDDRDPLGGTVKMIGLTRDLNHAHPYALYDGTCGFYNAERGWHRTFEPVSFAIVHEGRFL